MAKAIAQSPAEAPDYHRLCFPKNHYQKKIKPSILFITHFIYRLTTISPYFKITIMLASHLTSNTHRMTPSHPMSIGSSPLQQFLRHLSPRIYPFIIRQ